MRPLKQKKIGLLGGMSAEATSEYYRMINAAANARLGGWDIAETVIIGVNFGNIEYWVRNDGWDALGDYLAEKAVAAERAGADFLICASNTVHRVYERFTDGISIPFLHIADPTGAAIRAAGLKRILLLGTYPVMSAPYMRDYYARNFGLEIMVPDEAERRDVDRIIFDELCKGEISLASKARYLEIADKYRAAGAEGLIMGCTEICLLIAQADRPDYPMFDTAGLHVDAAVAMALEP
ncbi:aspartate/glutamate racemase family protein [Gimibacter soli]|uniref:Amino acid racemase n=1 Tax=Gimibacter soli TaxID=3024400 RepID=A0AAE9XV64_9PROT|nr:amino acid racemase [Gimibacter soli]WCL54333.1 amino acid racemase [Gimibacter soli]